jgi:hypothetical protein
MISRSTGEVTFQDLRIAPQTILEPEATRQTDPLLVPGWSHHRLGVHRSDWGTFNVEAVSDPERRVQILLLAHSDSFYQANTPNDAERRVFHEDIISSDLAGQREFSWGQVFCYLDRISNKDWLVLGYALGPQVPMCTAALLHRLYDHEPEPNND